MRDAGIFPDLDARVRLTVPDWLHVAQCSDALGLSRHVVLGTTVHASDAPSDAPLPACAPEPDTDRDGLPDALDLLRGAHKAALDAAPYGSPYRTLAYPGGDVPRGEGVCTDVVIRALRNAGIDLQRLVHDDIARAPEAYPMVARRNPSIDHRRVKTLLPWFRRHWDAQSTDASRLADWLPGDVVFMDTLAAAGPDHIGIVSDRAGPSGKPLVINSWTDGYRTSEMDLLPSVPVTHRFRAPGLHDDDLPRALARTGWSWPDGSGQAVLVQGAGRASSRAQLSWWQLDGRRWQRVFGPVPADLGHAGLAPGRGLHGRFDGKREGDGRTPTGLFAIGTAFSRGPRPTGVRWPWRRTTLDDHWVDDPASSLYNQWVLARDLAGAHAEPLARADGLYDPALVLEHNTAPVAPGAGSAIFLHVASDEATMGCVALPRPTLTRLIQWLRPEARPVAVIVDG